MAGEILEYDVAIVGAGPAGLATALRLVQREPNLAVCVLEKAGRIGGHLLSGAVIDPTAMDALIPDWEAQRAPLHAKVTDEVLLWLGDVTSHSLPIPGMWTNHGGRFVSLGKLCRWLARRAEEKGVDIFPGFTAQAPLFEGECLRGVVTGPFGLDEHGIPQSNFQAGTEISAPVTVLAEGSRGYLTGQVIDHLGLSAGCTPQTYALGIKELWQVPGTAPGQVLHTIGWPLESKTHGGGFLYQVAGDTVAAGFVVGLDYANPYLSPYGEFQRWKQHPDIRAMLSGGKPLAYGARTLTEGGWQSLPRLHFDGGLLVGDGAGFLDAARLKGIDGAIHSGIMAAETIVEAFEVEDFSAESLSAYTERVQNSKLGAALKAVRNVRPGFRHGRLPGLLNAAWEALSGGGSPWTLKRAMRDRDHMAPATPERIISYDKPDGRFSFDRLTSLTLAGVRSRSEQPSHILYQDDNTALTPERARYAAPETRFCPAQVFELHDKTSSTPLIRIQAGNCLHCKCCDIKDPLDAIRWTPPEAGSGPDYRDL